jgi:hypothetical protein
MMPPEPDILPCAAAGCRWYRVPLALKEDRSKTVGGRLLAPFFQMNSHFQERLGRRLAIRAAKFDPEADAALCAAKKKTTNEFQD